MASLQGRQDCDFAARRCYSSVVSFKSEAEQTNFGPPFDVCSGPPSKWLIGLIRLVKPFCRHPPRSEKLSPANARFKASFCSQSTAMTGTTQYLASSSEVALFEIDEMKYGRRLGKGGFCSVHEVRAIVPKNETHTSYSHLERVNRDFLKCHVKSDNEQRRYVIKTIKPEKMMPERDFLIAAGDLEMEASLLSSIRHSNIIRLRGIALQGTDAYLTTGRHDGYFLVLDRLKETLKDRIISWKRQEVQLTGPNRLGNHKRIMKRKQVLFVERLMVASQVASALDYLHTRRIVYRDLKANNVGFDLDTDEVKLFDFGLARPLPVVTDTMSGTYKMSGKAGTLRTMAPEVFRCEPYGTKADVYSFAHLLWEILSLQVPYAHCEKKEYKALVVQKGVRPRIDRSWPIEIQELLEAAWDPDMDERPPMKHICMILKRVVYNLKDCGSQQQRCFRRTVSPSLKLWLLLLGTSMDVLVNSVRAHCRVSCFEL